MRTVMTSIILGRIVRRTQLMMVTCWLLVSVILLAFNALVCGQNAGAKDYDTLPYADKYKIKKLDGSETDDEANAIKSQNKDKFDAIKDTRKEIANALKAGNLGSVSSKLDEFLNGYVFPEMTQTDPRSLSTLGELRSDLEKYFMNSRYPTAVREIVIKQSVLPTMSKIVNGNFHPAVRMNAIVAIGMLNDDDGSSRQAPVPTAEAFPILKSVLTDDKSPAYLKVGALAGIQRHIEISTRAGSGQVAAGELKNMSTYCVSILNNKASGQENWSPELNYWLKRRAMQVLGGIGEADADALNSMQIVLKTASQENEIDNFWLRFDALQALSFLKSSRIEKQKVSELMDLVTNFTSEALNTEANLLEGGVEDLVLKNILFEDKDLQKSGTEKPGRDKGSGRGGLGAGAGGLGDEGPGGAPPGGGRGAPGGGGPAKKEEVKPSVELPNYQLNASRERIKSVLYTARNVYTRNRGEEGLKKQGDQKENDRMDQIVDEIDRLMEASNKGLIDLSDLEEGQEPDDKNITEGLVEVYRKGAKDLKGLLLNPAAAEGAADELGAPAAAATDFGDDN